MKKICIIFLFTCMALSLMAQINLVPNPGFDSLTSCPVFAAEIYKAVPWIDPTAASSDLYNTCNTYYYNVPNSPAGYQFPLSGDGYSAIVTIAPSGVNHREYIQVPLRQPMQAGKTYCVQFYVSWADSNMYAADGMGAYFSQTPVSCTGCFLPYTAQVSNPTGNMLSDGSQWQLVKGSFIASGGESYMTIGNFKTDVQTTTQLINPNANYGVAYYYIDEVSVVEITSADAGDSSSICPGDSVQLGNVSATGVSYHWSPFDGLSDSTISNPIAQPEITTTYTLTQIQCDVTSTSTVTVSVKNDCNVIPQLFIPTILTRDQMLIIAGIQPQSKLEIFDMRGRIVFRSENYQNDFGAYNVAVGMYALSFTTPTGEVIKQKLCIVK